MDNVRTEVGDLRQEMNRRFDEIEETQTEHIASYPRYNSRQLEVFRYDMEVTKLRVERPAFITEKDDLIGSAAQFDRAVYYVRGPLHCKTGSIQLI